MATQCLNTDLDDGQSQTFGSRGRGEDNQIISSVFERLYYFGAFADLGHTGIKSIC